VRTGEPISVQMAEWFGGLEWSSIPDATRYLARLRMLDTIGLMLGGSTSEASSIARERARQNPGVATIAGAPDGVSAEWAAFANGVAAHCLDYDDTFSDSVVHPGSMIVPVALAIGEKTGASGADILTAIAGGYEIAARIAGLGGRRFHQRGFHASGIFAPIVSAFVASRLMRSSVESTASAVGLAASMSGGLMAFIADGSWSKWLHFGWGNFGGILAAQLAHAGFRGPTGALDGRHNLYAAFLGDPPVEFATSTSQIGEQWLSDAALFKLYPCAHVIQPYIDLALDLRGELAPDSRAISRIVCTVAPWTVPIVCEPAAEKRRPATMLQAIASLPFHVASALVDGRVNLDTLSESSRDRPEVAELANRVEYIADPELQGFGADIKIELRDGRIFERSGSAAVADGERLREKFDSLAGRVLPPDRVEELALAVASLADAPDASAIAKLLRIASPANRS